MRQGPTKTETRVRMRATLGRIDPLRHDEMSSAIRLGLSTFEPLQRARSILAFAPLRSEPRIAPLLDAWRAEGRRILLPRTLEKPGDMEMVELQSGLCDLPAGPHGVRTPQGAAWEGGSIDAILVPGVAFDRHGGRLGRGGGYYDRLLRKLDGTVTIGTAFDCQIESDVPRENHDQSVRFIVTEKSTFECRPGNESSAL